MSTRIDLQIAYFIYKNIKRYINKIEGIESSKIERDWNGKFANKIYFTLDYKGLKINLYKDSVLSKRIFDGFEEVEEKFIRSLLLPGDIFIDVGANIGLHSLVAAQVVGVQGKVISFEPTPKTFERLKENININKLENIIDSYGIGLSDEKNNMKFYVYGQGHDAWNSFALLDSYELSDQIIVPVDTLDNKLKELKLDISKISLIKIDVEGWELFVLKGAEQLLTKNNNISLLVEFTDENSFYAGTSCREVFRLLESYGYNWYNYSQQNNELIEAKMKPFYPYENLIATKNPELIKNRISGIKEFSKA